MEVAENILEFLDLKLKFDKEYKRILVEMFSTAINGLTYILLSTYFLRRTLKTFLKVLHYDYEELGFR